MKSFFTKYKTSPDASCPLLIVHSVFLLSFCIPCLISDEPDAPGAPEATDWDKDHVDLRWTPPVKDGGSPITGYIIEKREKGSPRWTKAAETKGPDCKGRADNLEEGVAYEFRVRAVNAAGPGQPSEASKPITAKPRKCMYNSVVEPVCGIFITINNF